jgi:hypothetical protein
MAQLVVAAQQSNPLPLRPPLSHLNSPPRLWKR